MLIMGSCRNTTPAVKAALDNFRDVYRRLASKFPSSHISYHYASKKADAQVHPNLEAEELRESARSLFSEAEIDVEFLGARRLLELARRRPKHRTNYALARVSAP